MRYNGCFSEEKEIIGHKIHHYYEIAVKYLNRSFMLGQKEDRDQFMLSV